MVSNPLTVFRGLKNEMGELAEGPTRNVGEVGIRKSVIYDTHYYLLQIEVLVHSNGNQEGIVGCVELRCADLLLG